MKPRERADLEHLLRTRAEALSTEAAQEGRVRDHLELAELERMARVLSLRPARRRARWTEIIVFATLVGVLVALYHGRVRTTAINGELVAGRAMLRLQRDQPLMELSNLSRLTLTGLDYLVVPRATGDPMTLTSSVVEFRTTAGGEGRIGLSGQGLPKGTELRFVAARESGRQALQLHINPEERLDLELAITVSGPVTLRSADTTVLLGDGGAELIMTRSRSDLALAMTAADTGTWVLDPVYSVSALDFDRTYRYADMERRLPTIRSVSLILEGFGNRRLQLGAGQALRFESVDLAVPYLAVERDQLRMRVAGVAMGMRTGGLKDRSLMPRWLEFLAQNPAINLIGSVGLLLLGYLTGLRGWFMRTEP